MTVLATCPFATASDTRDGSQNSPWSSVYVAQTFLRFLVDSAVIHPEDWSTLPRESLAILHAADGPDGLLHHLVDLHLLNPYQSARVQAGTTRGLILGNYRILGRIGAGGLGVVFAGEHIRMRRKVAIKVVPVNTAKQPGLVARFLREMCAVAQLDHPNIVAAIDGGVDMARGGGAGPLLLRHGIPGRQGSRAARSGRGAADCRCLFHHLPGGERSGRGASTSAHSSRHQAVEHLRDAGGQRQATRFRPGPALRRQWLDDVERSDRHAGFHGPRAGATPPRSAFAPTSSGWARPCSSR